MILHVKRKNSSSDCEVFIRNYKGQKIAEHFLSADRKRINLKFQIQGKYPSGMKAKYILR